MISNQIINKDNYYLFSISSNNQKLYYKLNIQPQFSNKALASH